MVCFCLFLYCSHIVTTASNKFEQDIAKKNTRQHLFILQNCQQHFLVLFFKTLYKTLLTGRAIMSLSTTLLIKCKFTIRF